MDSKAIALSLSVLLFAVNVIVTAGVCSTVANYQWRTSTIYFLTVAAYHIVTASGGQLSIQNTSAVTSVLVAWDIEAEEYTVMYREGDWCPSFNTLQEFSEEINVTTNSIILVSLSLNTSYIVRVCSTSSDSNCCCETFQTSITDPHLVNQVHDLRIHVYRPMINSEDVSAQVIWTALNAAIRPTSYDVQITTADEEGTDITGEEFFNLSLQKTFTNIVTRTQINELVYPIQTNQIYIVQVRGRNDTTNFSWSEPVWIDTKNEVFSPELYILNEAAVSLLFETSTVYTNFEIGSPFTLDKRNRVVFYFDQTTSIIYKANVDRPFQSKEFYAIQGIGDARSFTYDWIARRLYVTVTFNNGVASIFYLIDDDSDIFNRQPVSVYSINSMISETVVNPFTGFLHWTEGDFYPYELKSLDLTSEEPRLYECRSDLISQALAENTERRCIYVIKDGPQIMGDGENCNKTEIDLPLQFVESAQNNRLYLSIDEQGIYVFNGETVFYYSYDGMQKFSQNITQLQSNAVISEFDTLSPGAQPLSKQSCLSPTISGSVSIDVTERTATSFRLKWTAPDIIFSQVCQSVVASVPPIMYIIQIFGEDYENQTFSRSLTVTDLNSFQRYSVVIKARTEFTIGDDTVLAEREIEPFQSSIAIIPPSRTTTAVTATITSSTTTTGDQTLPTSQSSGTNSSSITQTPSPPPPTNPSRNNGNVVVVAGISGGLAVLIVVLVGVIIIVTSLICVKSQRTIPEQHPPESIYSDTTIERERQYATPLNLDPSAIPPSNYASLYPPNMDEPHPYVRCNPPPIRKAPEPYSEPVVSVRMSRYKGNPPARETKRRSQNNHAQQSNGSINNAVYFESNSIKKTNDDAYFLLERDNTGIPQITQACSEIPFPNLNPTFFELERHPVDEGQFQTCGPTPVQPPQGSTIDCTQSHFNTLGPNLKPTLFELQLLKDSTTDRVYDTPGLPISPNDVPVYFEQSHNQQRAFDTPMSTDQHEYIELNRSGKLMQESNQLTPTP